MGSYYSTMKKLSYTNKIILAPMVRVGTLPMRLLALDYGADIVYTEELIDWKFLKSTRRVNDVLNTIDFFDKTDGSVIFRTCAREKKNVVVQLGTCDPARVLKVVKLIENDVAGIDINMGCPKEFSIKGGMGSALLTQPEKAKAILETLVRNIRIPITCKIRVLDHVEDTLKLVRTLVSSGIAAIAIHGRTKQERPHHPNRNETIKFIAEHVDIPIIANGGSREIAKYDDIAKFKEECGSSSVMIARTAQGNCSIFSPNPLEELDVVIVKYLKYCIEFDNAPSNTKYCVQNMLKELQETPRGKRFLECQTSEQICAIWDLGEYCLKVQRDHKAKGILGRREITPDIFNESPTKKLKSNISNDMENIITKQLAFIRCSYASDPDLPKSRLNAWCGKHDKSLKPIYSTINKDKLFRSILTLDGKKYSSSFWEKNKKYAEQGAALVCINALGLIHDDQLRNDGSML